MRPALPERKERGDKTRPRVVRVIARLNVGGPAKHVTWLNHDLRDEFDSILITGRVPAGEQDMSSFASGYRVRRIVIPEMSREIGFKDLRVILKIWRILVRIRPDIVHTHTAKAGTVGRVAGLLYRFSTASILGGRSRRFFLIHTYHGHIFHSYYGRLRSRVFLIIEQVLARFATDRIIVISPQQFDEICHEYHVGKPEQFEVVPLGLDLDPFLLPTDRGLLRRSLNIEEERILIGIVGRLTEVKNHALFLRAAAFFNRDQPELSKKVTFVVIGEGQLRGSLERLAADLVLPNIVFAGLRDDPQSFYSGLDLVALTSLNEGTPLTLIEAMASGVPIVATKVGGVVDLAGESIQARPESGFDVHEHGILVRSGDAEAFGRALSFGLSEADLVKSMAARARNLVMSRYPRARLVSDIRRLYQDLLGEAGYSEPLRRSKSSILPPV